MKQEEIEQLYYQLTGSHPTNIERLSAAGSNREYFRVYGSSMVIAVQGTSPEENNAFIYLSSFFRKKNISVPEVYLHSKDKKFYLQEDLGNTILFDSISQGREAGIFSPEERLLLNKALQQLPAIQFAGKDKLDYSQCYPQPSFNLRSIFWDLNYFKYCFLKLSGLEFQEDHLENDFDTMGRILLEEPFDTFMYRDFQSRNVMIKDKKLFFIDFQGGRKGPLYYDIASFLWQAKGNYPAEVKEELLTTYLSAAREFYPIDEIAFRKRLRHFVLFRMLQVLGAYGFRGLIERKHHFLESIPFAFNNIRELLKEGYSEYPSLSDILEQLISINFAQQEDQMICLK